MTARHGHPCETHLGRTHDDAPKKSYHSKGQADAALCLIRTRGAHSEKKPIRAYCCPGCHKWFLTSSPD